MSPTPQPQLRVCRHCHARLAYRVSDRTCYRTEADANAGRRAISKCPKCGTSLYQRNLAN